jgi:hypothetical protein
MDPFSEERDFHGNGDHCKTFRFLEQKRYPESHSFFTLSLGILSNPYPLSQWYCKVMEILLNLSMKC